MGILSFLNPAAWVQTALAAVLAFGLGSAFGFVKGYDAADTKRLQEKIASLEADRKALLLVSKQKDDQIRDAEARYEEDQRKQEAFDAEFTKMLTARPGTCRLSDAELRGLANLAKR